MKGDKKMKQRKCIDCGKDISHRGNRSKRCVECQENYDRIYHQDYHKKWWRENLYHYSRKIIMCSNCGKSKQHEAFNLCKACYSKEYAKTPNGRKSNREGVRRCQNRRRGMGNFWLFDNPFPSDVKVDMHHINDFGGVPVPSGLHRKNSGGNNGVLHRELMDKCIKQLYGTNFKWFFDGN